MTSNTSFLNLKLYNTATDGASLIDSYLDDVAGVSASSNMKLIDSNASQVSASIMRLSASIVVLQNTPSSISGSSIMSGTTGSSVVHNNSTIYTGSSSASNVYTSVSVDRWGHVISGSSGVTSSVTIAGRVGGDPNNWSVWGTSASTPASCKMEVGVVRITWPGTVSNTSSSVVFPSAFGGYPIVYITRLSSGNTGAQPNAEPTSISNNSFVCYVNSGVSVGLAPSAGTVCDMAWTAIGPA